VFVGTPSLLAVIPSPPDPTLNIGPLELHYYGIAIAIGVALAFTITRRRYERYGGDGIALDRVMTWAVLIGFLGARAGYVATHLDQFFGPDSPLAPWQVIAIWEGGLAFFGGITFGAVAALVLLHRMDMPVLPFFDAVAVAVPVAQAIGRLGNWFNQELFGTPTDLPWALEVSPSAAARAGFPDARTFHPTFLYEALLNLLAVALILRIERRRDLRMGSVALLYLASYGVIRFLMELLRTDDQIVWALGIRNNGWIALLVLAVALVLLVRGETGRGDPLAGQVERDRARLRDAEHAEHAEDNQDAEEAAEEGPAVRSDTAADHD
jgi:prolipoprotein diacylglyceryl transferase